eukprot:764581-Hanusia_phi.AAC.6
MTPLRDHCVICGVLCMPCPYNRHAHNKARWVWDDARAARVLRKQEADHGAVPRLDVHRAGDVWGDRRDEGRVHERGAIAELRGHGHQDQELVPVEPGRHLHLHIDQHQRVRVRCHRPLAHERRAGPQAEVPALLQAGVPVHIAGVDAVRGGDGPLLHHGAAEPGGLPCHPHRRRPHRQHVHHHGLHERQAV